jgi:hypothetical protein
MLERRRQIWRANTASRKHAVQLEGQIQRHGRVACQAAAVAGRKEPQLKKLLAEPILDQAAPVASLRVKWTAYSLWRCDMLAGKFHHLVRAIL